MVPIEVSHLYKPTSASDDTEELHDNMKICCYKLLGGLVYHICYLNDLPDSISKDSVVKYYQVGHFSSRYDTRVLLVARNNKFSYYHVTLQYHLTQMLIYT